MKKRIISSILAVVMVVGLLPGFTITAHAAGEVTLLVNTSAADDSATRGAGARYKTLAGAVDKAVSGDTIKFESGSTIDVSVWIVGKALTLDLNDKLITCSLDSSFHANYAINVGNGAILTVTDTASGLGKIQHSLPIAITSNGTLNVARGTIEAITGNGSIGNGSIGNGAAIQCYHSEGTVNVSGGTVILDNGGSQFFGTINGLGTINVSGGTVVGTGDSPAIQNEGSVNITGGNISYIRLLAGCTANVTGGNINLFRIYSGCTANVTGGNINTIYNDGTLQNLNSQSLSLYTFTGGDPDVAISSLSVTPALDYTYGLNDVKTDGNGKIYVWLPKGITNASVTAGGKAMTIDFRIRGEEITGLILPYPGAYGQGFGFNGTGYSGIVTWSPSAFPFQAGTVYTGTFNLTAVDSYTFTGMTGSFTVSGATSVTASENTGATLKLTVVFPETPSPQPVTVAVKKDGAAWTGHGKSLALYKDGTSAYTLNSSGYNASVFPGTYDIYEGTTDTGEDITVSKGGANSATVNYYTVTFKSHDGITTLNTQTVLSGKTASYGGTTPIKTDDAQYSYAFSNVWVTVANGSTPATLTNITATKDVYASFIPTLRSYAITWKKDSTTTIDTTTVAYESTPSHADPTRTGYKFAGWTPSITSVTGDATYTAKWTADSYNITYQLNGGNVSAANPASYTSDNTAISLNNPTRDGYSFVGWSGTDLTGNTNQSVTIAPNSTGVKAYTANWKANTPTAPEASVVTAKTSTTLTLSTAVGYEYSLDNGGHWYGGTNGSYTFTSLNPGQSYNLVCRKAAVTTEGSVSAASDLSPALSVTIKNAAPGAPTLAFAAITENSVKITAEDGAEYSKDNGISWQDSNEFTGLESATKYTFAIRIKETGDTLAGTKASEEKYTTLPTVKAGGANYGNMTQAEATSEDVIKEALKTTADTAINDNSVDVTINKASYTEPVAGTSAKPAGIEGSYTFTIKLGKAGQTDETAEKTIVISATAFTGISDVDAVAAAKTAIKGGTVTVAFGADQTAKTEAVQSYVDDLLTEDATGVVATVTYDSENNYIVKILKGSVEDSTTITMTIVEDADPDIVTVNNAKNAAESASYLDMTQAVATDEAVIEAALKATAESAVNNDTVNVTVTKESYTAPIAGTSTDPAGTNGSYVFKIKVSKGAQTRFTSTKTIVIVATPYVEIPTYKITGIVQDGNSSNVQNAAVKLMHGQNQVGLSVQTDADGKFTIENVINGTYNLVVNKNGITVTTLVVVNNANNTLENVIMLPSGKTNSVVEVKPSTPSIVVGGLDKQFQTTATEPDKGVTSTDNDVVTSGGSVEIKLTAEKKDNTATNASDISATATSDGKIVGIFVDLSVLKTVKDSSGDEILSQSATLTELPNLIDVLIPLPASLQGKSSYVVYRYHGTDVNTITTEANPEGEKIKLIDNGATIKLTVKKFSTYAIAYTTPPTKTGSSSGGSGSSVVTPTITTEQSEGGKIAISTDKKTATITPDDGYVIADVMVDGKNVGATGNYTFTDSKNHIITAVFVKRSALAYYKQDNQKIYIGFSAIAGNFYKYVAPEGVSVEFRENPKNFTDNTIAWAEPSIDFVTEREIFLGTSQDTFGPNESMTRAMFVTAIGRLYERSYGSVSGTNTFSDVNENDYFAKYVAWANENGIIKGVGENLFAPNEKVTREQMAVIMLNFASFLKEASSAEESLLYADSTNISTWAMDGAKYCQETKVITGREGGSFIPQGNATRAEVAAVIERFVKTIVK